MGGTDPVTLDTNVQPPKSTKRTQVNQLEQAPKSIVEQSEQAPDNSIVKQSEQAIHPWIGPEAPATPKRYTGRYGTDSPVRDNRDSDKEHVLVPIGKALDKAAEDDGPIGFLAGIGQYVHYEATNVHNIIGQAGSHSLGRQPEMLAPVDTVPGKFLDNFIGTTLETGNPYKGASHGLSTAKNVDSHQPPAATAGQLTGFVASFLLPSTYVTKIGGTAGKVVLGAAKYTDEANVVQTAWHGVQVGGHPIVGHYPGAGIGIGYDASKIPFEKIGGGDKFGVGPRQGGDLAQGPAVQTKVFYSTDAAQEMQRRGLLDAQQVERIGAVTDVVGKMKHIDSPVTDFGPQPFRDVPESFHAGILGILGKHADKMDPMHGSLATITHISKKTQEAAGPAMQAGDVDIGLKAPAGSPDAIKHGDSIASEFTTLAKGEDITPTVTRDDAGQVRTIKYEADGTVRKIIEFPKAADKADEITSSLAKTDDKRVFGENLPTHGENTPAGFKVVPLRYQELTHGKTSVAIQKTGKDGTFKVEPDIGRDKDVVRLHWIARDKGLTAEADRIKSAYPDIDFTARPPPAGTVPTTTGPSILPSPKAATSANVFVGPAATSPPFSPPPPGGSPPGSPPFSPPPPGGSPPGSPPFSPPPPGGSPPGSPPFSPPPPGGSPPGSPPFSPPPPGGSPPGSPPFSPPPPGGSRPLIRRLSATPHPAARPPGSPPFSPPPPGGSPPFIPPSIPPSIPSVPPSIPPPRLVHKPRRPAALLLPSPRFLKRQRRSHGKKKNDTAYLGSTHLAKVVGWRTKGDFTTNRSKIHSEVKANLGGRPSVLKKGTQRTASLFGGRKAPSLGRPSKAPRLGTKKAPKMFKKSKRLKF